MACIVHAKINDLRIKRKCSSWVSLDSSAAVNDNGMCQALQLENAPLTPNEYVSELSQDASAIYWHSTGARTIESCTVGFFCVCLNSMSKTE